jgi:hypothetical protein
MDGMDLRDVSIGISFASFLVNTLVLVLLIWKGQRSRAFYLWVAFLGLIALWCFAETFIKSTDDFSTAVSWFRFVLVSGGFVPPLLLHFSLEFPRRHSWIKERNNRWLFYSVIYIPNIILLIKAEVMSFFISAISRPQSIWGSIYTRDSLIRVVAPDVYLPHYIFLISMIFIAMVIIVQNQENARNTTEKKQINMIVLALTFVFLPGVILDAALSMVFGVYTEFFSVLVSSLAVVTAIAMVKYQFLVISPMTEEFEIEPGRSNIMEPGYAYMIPENERKTGKKMFLQTLANNRQGLVITNRDPNDLRVDYGIKRTPIIYVGERSNFEFQIDPGNLDSLVTSLSCFAGMTKNPVILVDWDPYEGKGGKINPAETKKKNKRYLEQVNKKWFAGENLMESIDQSNTILSGGTSIIVFQEMVSKEIIRTQRPLQHIQLINFFLIERLLGKLLAAFEQAQGQSALFLNELSMVDPFFDGWNYIEGIVTGPIERIESMDRSMTVNKLRTIKLSLSRTNIKSASNILTTEWTPSNLGGFTDEEISIPEGAISFLATESASKPFRLMRELMAAGFQGMCLTTRPPEKVKHLYDLKGVEYRWITTSKSDDKKAIPVSLEHIRRDMREYIDSHKKSVVLLDGVELLISRLGFENVQRFLHVIKDELAITQSRLLIPINPKAIDDQRLALLRREVEI